MPSPFAHLVGYPSLLGFSGLLANRPSWGEGLELVVAPAGDWRRGESGRPERGEGRDRRGYFSGMLSQQGEDGVDGGIRTLDLQGHNLAP